MRIRGFTAFILVSILSIPSSPVLAEDAAKPRQMLTIYTNGLALVDEVRTLQPGVATTVRLRDVSPMMIPDSVQIGLGNDTVVREMAFDSDILTHQTLLRRALGKQVKLVRTNPATGLETSEMATVLSVSGGLILDVGGRIETNPPGRIVFDEVPDDLHSTPTLSLELSEPVSKPTSASLTYLSNGMSWDGVYTMVLNQAHTSAELDGWAKVNNSTGMDFNDVQVSLVAGDVRRVMAPVRGKMMMRAESTMMSAATADAPEPVAQELSAFHIYDIAGKATLRDKESRQLRLLSGTEIKISRVLEFQNSAVVFGPVRHNADAQAARQRVRFTNSDKNGLGKPLPAGLVRAYMRDGDGSLRFVGEDRIGNAPNGEELSLDLGRAFDVKMSRKQTEFKRIGDRSSEAAFDLEIRNGGKREAVVVVVENIPGDWKLMSSNVPHDREGISARWRIKVPAGGAETLSYRVFVRR